MAEDQIPVSSYERKVTWSLIGIILAFVLAMTCIVLWITTSLIRNELNGSSPAEPGSITGSPAFETPTPPTTTPTMTQTATQTATKTPLSVDATWTPSGQDKHVKFLYWYVKPNKITVGECVQLTWETENAVKLQLYRNDELFLEDVLPSETIQDCPEQLGYTVYRLVAENRAGESNWIQLQVKVVKAAP